MMRVLRYSGVLTLLAACAVQGNVEQSRVPPDPCAVEYLDAFTAGRRLENREGCTWSELDDQARSDRIQADVARAHPAGGAIVGYKVTSAEDGRVVGVITGNMLLPSGATVDLATGVRLLGEGDLLVRVKSTAINNARTLEDVAAEIEAVIPFIESSDLMLPRGIARTKAIWTASNGNARWGITGTGIDVGDREPGDIVALLGSVEVELIDETGRSLQTSGMRNNPLQSVLDVIQDLERRGDVRLQAGDVISLGNFGRPRFPKPGARFTAVFHGLADPAPRVVANYR